MPLKKLRDIANNVMEPIFESLYIGKQDPIDKYIEMDPFFKVNFSKLTAHLEADNGNIGEQTKCAKRMITERYDKTAGVPAITRRGYSYVLKDVLSEYGIEPINEHENAGKAAGYITLGA